MKKDSAIDREVADRWGMAQTDLRAAVATNASRVQRFRHKLMILFQEEGLDPEDAHAMLRLFIEYKAKQCKITS